MTEHMKDFDQKWEAEPQHRFRAGGLDFTVRRSVKPEKLKAWTEFDPKDAQENPGASIDLVDSLMVDLLEPESAAKWQELRRRDGEGELGITQMLDIVTYVTELIAGRPTTAPSPSQAGDGATGTSSTESSPSAEQTSVRSIAGGS